MSVGWQIALGAMMIAGGSVGFEYRAATRQAGMAIFEVCVVLGGMAFLATGIDRLVQS